MKGLVLALAMGVCLAAGGSPAAAGETYGPNYWLPTTGTLGYATASPPIYEIQWCLWNQPTTATIVVSDQSFVDFAVMPPRDEDFLHVSLDDGVTAFDRTNLWPPPAVGDPFWTLWVQENGGPAQQMFTVGHSPRGPWGYTSQFFTGNPVTVRFTWRDSVPESYTHPAEHPLDGAAADSDLTTATTVYAIGIKRVNTLQNVPAGGTVWLLPEPTHDCPNFYGWPLLSPVYVVYSSRDSWTNPYMTYPLYFEAGPLPPAQYHAQVGCGGALWQQIFYSVGVSGMFIYDEATGCRPPGLRVAWGSETVKMGAIPNPPDAQPTGGATSLWPDGCPCWYDWEYKEIGSPGDTTETLQAYPDQAGNPTGDQVIYAVSGTRDGCYTSVTFHVVAVNGILASGNGKWSAVGGGRNVYLGPEGSVDLLATSTLRRAYPDGWPMNWPKWQMAPESTWEFSPVETSPPDLLHIDASTLAPDQYTYLPQCGYSADWVNVSVLGLHVVGDDILSYPGQPGFVSGWADPYQVFSGGQYLWTSLTPDVVRFASGNPASPTVTTTNNSPQIVGVGPGVATLQLTYVSDPDSRGMTASASAELEVKVFQLNVTPDAPFLAVDSDMNIAASVNPSDSGGPFTWSSDGHVSFVFGDQEMDGPVTTWSNEVTVRAKYPSSQTGDAQVTVQYQTAPGQYGQSLALTGSTALTVYQLSIDPPFDFLAVGTECTLDATLTPSVNGGHFTWDATSQLAFIVDGEQSPTAEGQEVVIKGVSHSLSMNDAILDLTYSSDEGYNMRFGIGAPRGSARALAKGLPLVRPALDAAGGPNGITVTQRKTVPEVHLSIFNEHNGPELAESDKVTPGSFVLVNIDDDNGDGQPDNANSIIDGDSDKLDMAKMSLAAYPADLAGATIDLSADDSTKVHVFNDGDAMVMLPETIDPSRFAGGPIDYHVEGVNAGAVTFTLKIKLGATAISQDSVKVTVVEYAALEPWPGGNGDTSLNPTETFYSSLLGLAQADWTVTDGGTQGAVIVSTVPAGGSGSSVTGKSSITVRYDSKSADATFGKGVEVKAYGTGSSSFLAACRRTVFAVTWADTKISGDLDSSDHLSFLPAWGTDTRKCGFNWKGDNGATKIAAKVECTASFDPPDVAPYITFVDTSTSDGSACQCRACRKVRFAEGTQGLSEPARVWNYKDWDYDGSASAFDCQHPGASTGGNLFRIDAVGERDPASYKQLCLRADFQEFLEWHNGSEWKRCSPYCLHYTNITGVLALPNPCSEGTPNDQGTGNPARTMPNTRPVAVAGAAQVVLSGASVQLDGSGSTDADQDNLTYRWTQTGGPAVTLLEPVTLQPDSTSEYPVFAAPTVSSSTILTFELKVQDGTQNLHEYAPGNSESAANSVSVTVNPH